MRASRAGKIPTTSVRRRISWLSRSWGLFDQPGSRATDPRLGLGVRTVRRRRRHRPHRGSARPGLDRGLDPDATFRAPGWTGATARAFPDRGGLPALPVFANLYPTV